jgi:hypothetical protein
MKFINWITVGLPVTPDKEDARTIATMYQTILKDSELRTAIKLHENKQHLMTSETWSLVKEKLLTKLVNPISGHPEITKEDLILYCSGVINDRTMDVYLKLKAIYDDKDISQVVKLEIHKLAVLKMEFSILLSQTLQKCTGQHHGPSQKNRDYLCAKPYIANNTPNEASEFTDSSETINRTFQMLYSSWKECNYPDNNFTSRLIEHLLQIKKE